MASDFLGFPVGCGSLPSKGVGCPLSISDSKNSLQLLPKIRPSFQKHCQQTSTDHHVPTCLGDAGPSTHL